MIARPIITLVPSIFSLFSLPFVIVSYSLGCQNIEISQLRYVLMTSYFISFIPPVITFFLYISPSTLYVKEWQSTSIGKRIAARQRKSS
jgi:hypothetical protein